jgi:hypothetical protein
VPDATRAHSSSDSCDSQITTQVCSEKLNRDERDVAIPNQARNSDEKLVDRGPAGTVAAHLDAFRAVVGDIVPDQVACWWAGVGGRCWLDGPGVRIDGLAVDIRPSRGAIPLYFSFHGDSGSGPLSARGGVGK